MWRNSSLGIKTFEYIPKKKNFEYVRMIMRALYCTGHGMIKEKNTELINFSVSVFLK